MVFDMQHRIKHMLFPKGKQQQLLPFSGEKSTEYAALCIKKARNMPGSKMERAKTCLSPGERAKKQGINLLKAYCLSADLSQNSHRLSRDHALLNASGLS